MNLLYIENSYKKNKMKLSLNITSGSGQNLSKTEADPNIKMKNIDGRVGSYAISTLDLNSWMNGATFQPQQKIKKTRGTKEIIHKIFADCAEVIDDPYWITKFNNISIGKFPPKFSYNDGVLTYRKGTKYQTLNVSENAYEASHACIEFFQTNGSIFSSTDEQNASDQQRKRAEETSNKEPLTWATATKKDHECLISYYTMGMQKLMELTELEVEQLRQTLRLGISNKFFGKHNITVENNRIQAVNGILWNPESRKFYIDKDLKPDNVRVYSHKKSHTAGINSNQKDMIPQFDLKWNKYLEALNKKCQRSEKHQKQVTINHQTISTPTNLPHGITTSISTTNTDDIEDNYIEDDDISDDD